MMTSELSPFSKYSDSSGKTGLQITCDVCQQISILSGSPNYQIDLARKKFLNRGWLIDRSRQVCPECLEKERQERRLSQRVKIHCFGTELVAQQIQSNQESQISLPPNKEHEVKLVAESPTPIAKITTTEITKFQVTYFRRRARHSQIKHIITMPHSLLNKLGRPASVFFCSRWFTFHIHYDTI